MAKKVKHPEHVNHERWLISYADFITLLFAFFVVMFAVSQTDSKKLGRFTEAVTAAQSRYGIFDSKSQPQAPVDSSAAQIAAVGGKGARRDGGKGVHGNKGMGGRGTGWNKKAALKGAIQMLLGKAIQQNRVSVVDTSEGLEIRLRTTQLFQSGASDLNPEYLEEMQLLGQKLGQIQNQLRIEGHTDSIPISTPTYRSNWDLSASRASSVLRFFHDDAGIAQERMSISGYADSRPIATNDSPEGRAENRRVVIVVIDAPRVADTAAAGDVDEWIEDEAAPPEEGEEEGAPAGTPLPGGMGAPRINNPTDSWLNPDTHGVTGAAAPAAPEAENADPEAQQEDVPGGIARGTIFEPGQLAREAMQGRAPSAPPPPAQAPAHEH